MQFKELLAKFQAEGKKCFINGMPEEEGGKVLKLEDDFVEFEIVSKAAKQENSTKEVIFIPLNQISTLSEGEKKISTLTGSLEVKKEGE